MDADLDLDAIRAELAKVDLGDGAAGFAIAERLLAEVEQLRYERHLLGVARMTLDLVAAGHEHGYPPQYLRDQAADVAQRIVDEIGHPVTDEQALGPSMREEIERLAAELAEARKPAPVLVDRDGGRWLPRQMWWFFGEGGPTTREEIEEEFGPVTEEVADEPR